MHQPSPVSEKAHIQSGASTPYRGRYRTDPDVIPIHEQCFPTDRRLPIVQNPTLHPTLRPTFSSVDLVPVSDEVFPVKKSVESNVTASHSFKSAESMQGSNSAKVCAGATVSVVSAPTHEVTTPPSGQELGSSVATYSTRFERKIRGAITFGWFESYGEHDLSDPPVLPAAHEHDLFVHHYGYGYARSQLWICFDGKWKTVEFGHPHPSLPEHRLILKDKRPSWVTKQTVTTYASRDKTSSQD